MWRLFAIAGLVFLSVVGPATACMFARPYDPDETIRGLSPDEIIASLPEIVIEGVVVGTPAAAPPVSPADGPGTTFVWDSLRAEMQVERVWKGTAPPAIKLRFNPPSGDCIHEPPLGQQIRIGVIQLSDGDYFYDGFYDLPRNQPSLDGLLRGYRERSDALEAAAKAGDRADQLAFGEYLFQNNELHRARDVYEALRVRDPGDLEALVNLVVIRTWLGEKAEPGATLAELRRRAPPGDAWRGRMARARFAADGTFEPGWHDWSNLDAKFVCNPGSVDLSNASFDGANLDGCIFDKAKLHNASFRGANLHRAYLGDSVDGYPDLKGATYDCATLFRDDFDPVEAAMVNVEGACARP